MTPGRNDPCPCGSGKKYKKCCQGERESNQPTPVPIKPSTPAPAECERLAALFNAGRHDELEKCARLLVEMHPESGIVWKALGVSLSAQGKQSLPVMQRAAELLPNDAEAHSNLGIVLRNFGRLDAAVASYRRAIALKSDYAEAHNNLGLALRELGQLADAEASYRRALQFKPDYAEVYNNLGNILRDLGRLEDAEASCRRALALRADYAEAHNSLGLALQALGQHDAAVASCRRALEIKPDYAEAHNSLGIALNDLGQYEAAAASHRRALKIRPDFAEAHSNLGNALQVLGQLDDAVACYRRALEIKPDFAKACSNLGIALRDLGRLDEAAASCRRALQIKPDYVEARLNLAQFVKAKAGDENMAALIELEKSSRIGAGKEAVHLYFALGKCHDDIGAYDKAFPHFIEGCRLKRATFDYDPEQTTHFIDGIMRNYDAASLDRLRGSGDPSPLPVFVLGMPRSGTTLVEQIIASHPEVHGAGELHDLMEIAQRNIAGAGFPDHLRLLDHAQLAAMAAEYVARLQRRAPEKRRITDKMPRNFFALGLIHLMLPNAKIIHVERNPVDTCLSCFNMLFAHGQEHTYDLAELGRYYVDYHRLMQHWREVLPAGAFLDVQYEDIVSDKEAQSRRLVEYCGLEWHAACLDFHKTERAVQTASVVQVRQPIYQSSVERWRNYEKFLSPLLDALGELAPVRR